MVGGGLLSLWLAAGSVAAENWINFDDAADGTVVNTRYAGVTFTNALGGNIYARASMFAPSPGNAVSVFATGLPEFDARFGAVEVHFQTPMKWVSIDARPEAPLEFLTPLTKRPFIQAFDAGGVYLGATYYAGELPDGVGEIGPAETLTYTSASANIVYVRFSSQNPAGGTPTYGLFDNLRFDVGTKPYILTQPTGGTVSSGESFAFSAGVTGDPPLAYQWQRDAVNLANETNATLVRTELTPIDNGGYRVIVTNRFGAVTSSIVTLTVPPNLAEALDTSGLTWVTGGGDGWYRTTSSSHDGVDAATCQAPGLLFPGSPWMQTTVSGPGTVRFWWLFPASLLTSDYLTFSVDGVEQARVRMRTLALWASQTHYLGGGTHTLRWAYFKGGNFAGGPARVDQVSYTEGGTAPLIATQPLSQTVTGGTNVEFSVDAAGTPPLTYQWQWNEVNLPGANDDALSLAGVNPARAGNYRVVVTNAYGSITSAVAVLTILPGVNTAPIVEPIPDFALHAGVTFNYAVQAVDADVPTNVLTYSLLTRPSGMSIDALGVIAWQLSEAQLGTNVVTVKVADDAVPSLSATQRFEIVVYPRPVVKLNRLLWVYVGEDILGNRQWRLYPELSWSAISNHQYRLFYTTNVAAETWSGMMTTNLPFRPLYVTATGAVATALGPAAGTRVQHLFPREVVESVQPMNFYRVYIRP